jgi:hypothetical protein
MSVAPAGTSNVLVAVSGVLQDPSTYGVSGNTLTFTTAPPPGTGNISCRYLGIPVTGVTTTAYRTVTEFTATASQTTFTPPSYTAGYINVYLNGVLLGSSDYTASNGTTVVLATGAASGNLVTVESFLVSSVLNAIPNTPASVGTSNIQSSVTLTTPTIDKINTSVTNTSLGAGNASIMKNRIINGAMVVAQRGTSAVSTNVSYPVDRFRLSCTNNSKVSLQQSTTVPTGAGFVNSILATSLAATTVGSTDTYEFDQQIEGYNTADLMWGTANAKTVTLSFWVRSSLTGTFGGTFENSGNTRAYPFSYTISSANTWEQKSITVAGDTTGTWLTDNSRGIIIRWSLGVGSSYQNTANAWVAGDYQSVTGETQLVATNGATLYLTGVQLEVGSSATGFEYVNYQTSLANCQRYFQMYKNGTANGPAINGFTQAINSTDSYGAWTYIQPMRSAPTLAYGGTIRVVDQSSGFTITALSFLSSETSNYIASIRAQTASGMTAYRIYNINNSSDATAYISISAEL